MFFSRQFWNAFKLTTGIEQDVHERQEEWPDFFDISEGDTRHGKGYRRKRDPSKVTTIVLHQTACKFGTMKRNRDKYGDRGALHRRFFKTTYSCIALLNGDVLWNNDLKHVTWHGNLSNRYSIGVGAEGSFPGLERKRTKKHHALDDFVIATIRQAVRVAHRKAKEEGAALVALQAHRNYTGGRVPDPGERIWDAVAIPMAKELDLLIDYTEARGTGMAIPHEWDPSGLVDYRGRPIRD